MRRKLLNIIAFLAAATLAFSSVPAAAFADAIDSADANIAIEKIAEEKDIEKGGETIEKAPAEKVPGDKAHAENVAGGGAIDDNKNTNGGGAVAAAAGDGNTNAASSTTSPQDESAGNDDGTDDTVPTEEEIAAWLEANGGINTMADEVEEEEGVLDLSNRTSVGRNEFRDRTDIKKVIFSSKLMTIKDSAFSGCSSLETIEIPDWNAITTLGELAFNNCSKLRSASIPAGLTEIPRAVFSGCSSLELGDLVLSDNVTAIGERAFADTRLTSVYIPDSVKSIGDQAFSKCSSLTSIRVPADLESIPSALVQYCSSLASFDIPDSVTEIGTNAFYRCTSLETIKIPDGVTSISDQAFSGCSSLETIEIPDSVKSIGRYAFSECALTSIAAFANVETIGEAAFSRCTLLSIEFPKNLSSIGDYVFSQCSRLTSVDIPGHITSIGSRAFNSCSSLESVSFGDGILSIGDQAFRQCSLLTSIDFPSSITTIGSCAFYDCKALKSIKFVEGGDLATIDSAAFWNTGLRYYHQIEGLPLSILTGLSKGYGNVYAPTASNYADRAFVLNCSHTTTEYDDYYFADWQDSDHYPCSDGILTATCPACGKKKIGGVVPAADHEWSEWETILNPSCYRDGERESHCVWCGESKTELVPSPGHSLVPNILEPTCSDDGWTELVCLDCGCVVDYEDLPAPGHDWSAWETAQEPTCAMDGYRLSFCHNCGDVRIDTLPALVTSGHIFQLVEAFEPTCEVYGNIAYLWCSECLNIIIDLDGNVLDDISDAWIDPLDHDWSDWCVVDEATYDAPGLERRECLANSEHFETREIPMLELPAPDEPTQDPEPSDPPAVDDPADEPVIADPTDYPNGDGGSAGDETNDTNFDANDAQSSVENDTAREDGELNHANAGADSDIDRASTTKDADSKNGAGSVARAATANDDAVAEDANAADSADYDATGESIGEDEAEPIGDDVTPLSLVEEPLQPMPLHLMTVLAGISSLCFLLLLLPATKRREEEEE